MQEKHLRSWHKLRQRRGNCLCQHKCSQIQKVILGIMILQETTITMIVKVISNLLLQMALVAMQALQMGLQKSGIRLHLGLYMELIVLETHG